MTTAPVDVASLREIVRREDALGVAAAVAERVLAAGAEVRDRCDVIASAEGYTSAVRDAVRRDLANARTTFVLFETWLMHRYGVALVGPTGVDPMDAESRAGVARELRHLADAIEADSWLGARAAVQVGADAAQARAELAKVVTVVK